MTNLVLNYQVFVITYCVNTNKKTSWESSLCERAKFPVSKRILIQSKQL